MEAMTLPVYNIEGKEVDSAKLDETVFGGNINSACLHQVINAYRANQRKGLASTKTRGEVSGGGHKPWRQKGTGRARVGSIRSPLWRHGGVIFGPHPRDFYYKVPGKMKRLALKSALCAKAKENNLIVLDNFRIEANKTKEAVKIFSNLNINSVRAKRPINTLLLLDKIDDNLLLALRNIDFLSVNLAKYTHAYEVLVSKKIIITKKGLVELTKRLSPLEIPKL
jgi:large subunit ribosomal protein L4